MDIPSYTVYRSKRSSIRIVMRADGTLAVYCPKRCSKQYIDGTVAKHYAELKQKHDSRGNVLFGDNGSSLFFLGTRYPVIYNNDAKKLSFDGKYFISPTEDKCAIRKEYREFLRKSTKDTVIPLVKEYAAQFEFNYGKISIKSSYSRFGSCSGKKNLNFSLALAAFDMEFIRFVVCHELCHTVHLNHSAQFYALLDKVYPDHRAVKTIGAKKRSELLKSIFFNPAS